MITKQEKCEEKTKTDTLAKKLKPVVEKCQTLYEVWPNLKIYREGKYCPGIMKELRKKYADKKPK